MAAFVLLLSMIMCATAMRTNSPATTFCETLTRNNGSLIMDDCTAQLQGHLAAEFDPKFIYDFVSKARAMNLGSELIIATVIFLVKNNWNLESGHQLLTELHSTFSESDSKYKVEKLVSAPYFFSRDQWDEFKDIDNISLVTLMDAIDFFNQHTILEVLGRLKKLTTNRMNNKCNALEVMYFSVFFSNDVTGVVRQTPSNKNQPYTSIVRTCLQEKERPCRWSPQHLEIIARHKNELRYVVSEKESFFRDGCSLTLTDYETNSPANIWRIKDFLQVLDITKSKDFVIWPLLNFLIEKQVAPSVFKNAIQPNDATYAVASDKRCVDVLLAEIEYVLPLQGDLNYIKNLLKLAERTGRNSCTTLEYGVAAIRRTYDPNNERKDSEVLDVTELAESIADMDIFDLARTGHEFGAGKRSKRSKKFTVQELKDEIERLLKERATHIERINKESVVPEKEFQVQLIDDELDVIRDDLWYYSIFENETKTGELNRDKKLRIIEKAKRTRQLLMTMETDRSKRGVINLQYIFRIREIQRLLKANGDSDTIEVPGWNFDSSQTGTGTFIEETSEEESGTQEDDETTKDSD